MAREIKLEGDRRSPEAVREEIARARAELVHSVGALRDEMAERIDWRAWVRRRPLECMAGAFVVGFLLGERR